MASRADEETVPGAGEPGVKKEWWYHIASGTWFIAERDTLKDDFVRTYLYENDSSGGQSK